MRSLQKFLAAGSLLVVLTGVACKQGGGGGGAAAGAQVAKTVGFSPVSGTVNAIVTIVGGNFSPSVFENQVQFNGTPASILLSSSSTIIAIVPNGATTGPIQVASPTGTFQSSGNFKVLPAVTAINPGSAPVGSVVTVTGSALVDLVSVTFNGAPAVISGSDYGVIEVLVPPDATSGPVEVVTQAGTVTAASNFKVLPAILAILPPAALANSPVTISGTTLIGVSKVTFGGVEASPFQNNDSSSVDVVVPLEAPSGVVEITTVDGVAQSLQSFLVLPAVLDFSPKLGAEGDTVTIQGNSFFGVTEVSFGGVLASFTVLDSHEIEAVVPSGAVDGALSIKTSGGTGNSALSFSVLPKLLGFLPGSGIVGSQITLQGTSFTNVTNVTFNGVPAASFIVLGADSIQAEVPDGATSGPVEVFVAAGSSVSAANFQVLPFLSDFSPLQGPVGATVTIQGTTFVNVLDVLFNGVSASSFANPDYHTVTAVVPQGAVEGPVEIVTSDGTTTSVPLFSVVYTRFALVVNQVDSTLSLLSADGADGGLRHNGYVVTGESPKGVAHTQDGNFVFVSCHDANELRAYEVDVVSGEIAPIETEATASKPESIAVDPSGTFLYLAQKGAGSIRVFRVLADGNLDFVEDEPCGDEPAAVAVHPSGEFVFSCHTGSDDLSVFSVDPGTGALTFVETELCGNNPAALAFDATGKTLYAASSGSAAIWVFSIDEQTGALAFVEAEPAGLAPSGIASDPFGRLLYVANRGGNSLSVFSIDANTGTLALLETEAAGGRPGAVGVDVSGRFLYVVNGGSNDLSLFSLDANAQGVTPAGSMRVRSGPFALSLGSALAPYQILPERAYVANYNTDDVGVFLVDPATGIPSGGVSTPVGDGPVGFGLGPRSEFAYVPHFKSLDIRSYAVDPTTGLLAQIDLDVVGISGEPTVDPSGRFLFLSNPTDGSPIKGRIRTLWIQPDGTLDPSGPQEILTKFPRGIALDPTGRFLYATSAAPGNPTEGQLDAFSIDPATGGLTPAPGSPIPFMGPRGPAVHPTGRFFYAVNDRDDTISAYKISALNGGLTLIGSVSTGGNTPYDVAIDPLGRFAFVINSKDDGTGNSVAAFTIDPNTGSLSSVGTQPTGNYPNAVQVDASGRFVFVSNQTSDNLSVYEIDQTTGALTPLAGSPFANVSSPGAPFAVGISSRAQ